MVVWLGIIFIALTIIMIITAFWGPRKWLAISGASAFLLGVTMGMLQGADLASLVTGICLGIVLVIFIVSSGFSVRKYQQEGWQTLRAFFHGRKGE